MFSRALKALGLTDAGVWRLQEPTRQVGPRRVRSVSCVERQNGTILRGEVGVEDDLLTGEELKLFQSVAARYNFLAMDRPDPMYTVKELMRQMASLRTQDLSALKRSPQLEESRCRVVRL